MVVAVSLEGNIGAGKSTLLRELQRRGTVCVEQEPVDEWCAPVLPSGDGMLQAFYRAPQRNGFAFQLFVLLSRAKQAARVCGMPGVVVTERCVASDFELFAVAGRESGNFSDPEWATYEAWHRHVAAGAPPLSAVIYLRCSPETCARRVGGRARPGESAIQPEWLAQLHARHERWIRGLDVPVIELDAEAEDVVALADRVEGELLARFGGSV